MKSQQRKAKPQGGDQAPPPEVSKEAHNRGLLWVQDGEYVKPIKVKTGLNDGLMTEIVGGDVEEGTAIVVGENRATDGSGGASNPFTPKMFNGAKKPQ
jgi:hypothetical protein